MNECFLWLLSYFSYTKCFSFKLHYHLNKIKVIIWQTHNPKFKKMLINLVENAIKYTEDDGNVKTITNIINEKVSIKVQDNGIGISEEHIPRLFERFYRVDKARSREKGGTGLGLAIVKYIVINFGGTIKVDSKINEGTTFTTEFNIK